jgi:hypothetical protein
MTDAKPKRRWFRFSLRTLFVLVAIAGITVGWLQLQRNLIHQRQTFLAKLPEPCRHWSHTWAWVAEHKVSSKCPPQSVSYVRKWLGDAAYYQILLPEDHFNDLIGEANRLFPEAMFGWLRNSTIGQLNGQNTDVGIRRVENRQVFTELPE